MSFDLYHFLIIGVPLFLFSAVVMAWIADMEGEKFLQKIDQKIANEIRRRCSIDGASGKTIEELMPAITRIRHDCKKENRFLFFYTFLVSFVSFIGGAVFIIRSQ
jgi:hypothetical protein